MVPAQTIGPGPQVPTRNISFDEVDDVPNWKDVTPRLGVAYDLFGTGKTAVKFSIGKYLEAPNPPTVHASRESGRRARPERDAHLDRSQQRLRPAGRRARRDQPDQLRHDQHQHALRPDDVLTNRGYNWELAAQVPHELVPRVRVNAGYFRRWYGNFRVTDNLSLTPADYNPYCVTAPIDARLPDGGGYQVCGLYDVKRIVTQNNLISKASTSGPRPRSSTASTSA